MLALICAIGAFLPAGPAATGVRSRAAVRVEPKTSMVALDRRAVALGALAAAMTPLASQAKFVDLRDTDAAPATASKPAAASKPASKPTSKPAPKPAAKKTPPKPVDPKVAAARAKQERKVQAAKNKMAAKEKTRTAQQARDKAAKDAAAKRAAAETAQKAKAREAKRVALVAKQSQKQQAAKNKLAKKKKGGGASACLDFRPLGLSTALPCSSLSHLEVAGSMPPPQATRSAICCFWVALASEVSCSLVATSRRYLHLLAVARGCEPRWGWVLPGRARSIVAPRRGSGALSPDRHWLSLHASGWSGRRREKADTGHRVSPRVCVCAVHDRCELNHYYYYYFSVGPLEPERQPLRPGRRAAHLVARRPSHTPSLDRRSARPLRFQLCCFFTLPYLTDLVVSQLQAAGWQAQRGDRCRSPSDRMTFAQETLNITCARRRASPARAPIHHRHSATLMISPCRWLGRAGATGPFHSAHAPQRALFASP